MQACQHFRILLLFQLVALGTAHAGLNPTPILTLDGSVDVMELGTAVATAGDVNGDGYSEILVGEWHYATLLGGNTGRARLYLGGPGGPDNVADWTAEGFVASSRFGYSVATAGDVNGDGYDDVLVGAPNFTAGQSGEGIVYLYFGSASGLSATPAWSFQSDDPGANLGFSVAGAGDVNGDTYDDLVLGAPFFTNTATDQGRVFIFHGRSTIPLTTPARALDGFLPGDAFGYSVSTAGDVNADGYSDVLIGAPLQNILFGPADAGAAWGFHGGASGVDATNDWLVLGTQLNEGFGSSVSLAGDTNGDGFSDVLVGSAGFDGAFSATGKVFGFLGASTGLATTPARTYEGGTAGEDLGRAVATGGDINGDGYADFLIGAPGFEAGQPNEGVFHAYYGGLLSFPPAAFASTQINIANAALGYNLQTAGDVNGDGFSDVIAGAPLHDGPGLHRGRVLVYLGGADYPVAGGSAYFSAEANQAGAALGSDVAYADVNGDGYSDLLAGSPNRDGAVVDAGRAQCWLGGPSGVSGSATWNAESTNSGSRFGVSLAGAGDINGDGYDELIVGAPGFDAPAVDQGSAFVYSGSSSGLSLAPTWSSAGFEAGSQFGASVDAAGDFNGDGFADVIVGMPRRTNPQPREGAAVLFLGGAAGLGGFTVSWEGNQDDAVAGTSVAGAGDINGDGYSDIIVGAPAYDNGQTDEGMVFVFYGSAPPYANGPAQFIERNVPGALFGQSVASAGDVNGDGYSDIVVGAPGWSNGQSGEGSVAVYLGSPSGLGTSPAFSYESNQVSGEFGASVAPAGDLNKDGYSDILVGSGSLASGGGQVRLFTGTLGSLSAFPVWTEQGQPLAGLGSACTGAGDVDGDGYPDYAIGSSRFDNGAIDEGEVRVYRGNRHATQSVESLEIRPIQLKSSGLENLPLLGMTDSENTIQFGRYLRSPSGRGRVRFDWDIEPLGSGFPVTNTSPQWYDSGPAAPGIGSRVAFQGVASNLAPGTAYHWRGRTRAHSPFFPRTPWLSFSGNAALETDFRTRPSTSGVAEVDTPRAGLRISRLVQAGGSTVIRFELPETGHARLTLHDVSGRLVATLADADFSIGSHQLSWEGRSDQGVSLAAGVYLARLASGPAVARARLVLLH